MKEELGTWGAVLGATVLACLFGGLVIAIYPGWGVTYKTLFGSDFAWGTFWTAASAVGTFAAAVAAVWVALRQSSQQSKQEMRAAQLYAARISVRLDQVSKDLMFLSNIYDFHEPDQPGEPQMAAFDELCRWFRVERYEPSNQELFALIPLPNQCANRIARAYDNLSAVRTALNTPSTWQEFREASTATRSDKLQEWSRQVYVAADLLAFGAEECKKASLVGAPEPSQEEKYGDAPF